MWGTGIKNVDKATNIATSQKNLKSLEARVEEIKAAPDSSQHRIVNLNTYKV
jgi:hypothetical protein